MSVLSNVHVIGMFVLDYVGPGLVKSCLSIHISAWG